MSLPPSEASQKKEGLIGAKGQVISWGQIVQQSISYLLPVRVPVAVFVPMWITSFNSKELTRGPFHNKSGSPYVTV